MKSSGIGGQAVLEGVMMKNQSRYSVAVRKPDGEIEVTTGHCRSIAEKSKFFRLPVIRGVVCFVESLILGMKTLTYSSSFYEEEESPKEEGKAETAMPEMEAEVVSMGQEAAIDWKKGKQPLAEEAARRKENIENILIVILSIVLAVGFFMLLPFFLSELLRSKIHSQTTLALLEGVLRILLFLGYVIAISFLGDIKRVFMYHGAEHKTINCVENGLDLTVENVRKQTKHHRRCGTSFLFIVMFVSIIFFLFIQIDNIWLRMLFRVLLIPVIAGVSFEFIRFAGNSDSKVVGILSKPGMLLQRLTTREPDDSMIEVAIASVEAVFDWKKYQNKLLTEQERVKKKGAVPKIRKSRAQKKKELEQREQAYRNRALERARQIKEREAKEAERERKYQDIEKRKAVRLAAMRENEPAPKVEVEPMDELKNLDHYFDEKP